MPDAPRDPTDTRWHDVLSRLGAPEAPSPELEARVRASLEAQRARLNPRRLRRRLWVGIAALILVTVAGFLFLVLPGTAPPAGPRYLFLLYEGNWFDPGSVPHEQLVAEYGDWARALAKRGKLIEAAELGEEERLVSGADVPTRGAAGVISGFFIVRAADLNEASALAATCPHLKYGGEVAVRPLRES